MQCYLHNCDKIASFYAPPILPCLFKVFTVEDIMAFEQP